MVRDEETSAEDRFPAALLASAVILTLLPFALVLAGLPSSRLDETGTMVQGLAEWSQVLVTLFTAFVGILYLKVRRDAVVGVITLASLASVLWYGMHAMASFGIVDLASYPPSFVPWSWAAARTLAASVLGVGTACILLSRDVRPQFGWRGLVVGGAVLALVAYSLGMVFPGSSGSPVGTRLFVTRPWDVASLLLFAADGLVVFPLLVRRRPDLLSKTLLLTALPETLASAEMVFGSASPGGELESFTAHGLELAGSILVLTGIAVHLLRSYREEIHTAETMEKLVSDLKRAEDDLRSKEIQLNQLTSSIKEVFWISSGDGSQMHYVSPAYEEIFGLSCEELHRDPGAFLAVVHPNDKAAMTELLVNQVEEEFEIDYRIARGDGEIRWLRTRGFPIRNRKGAVYRIAGLTEDVTERKRSEQDLRRSEARQRALLRAMPDIMFRMSRSGIFLDYHAQPTAALFRPPSVFLGARVQDVLPGIGEIFASRIQETLATGVVQSYEYRLDCQGGRPGYFEARFAPSSDDEVLVVVRDVTEQTRLERELLEVSNRERERLGHDLHDGLSQQLTGIALLCKVLQQQLDDEGRPQAERARQIEALVEDTLSQTKSLARGLAPVELDGGGLAAALQDLAHGVESLHGVRCHCRCDPGVPIAGRAEAVHLYRIAQEAVSNALKHGTPSRIAIELGSSTGGPRLTIEDDGSGIQDDADTRRGMGLHIMRYRARMIDGTLQVRRLPRGGTLVACEWPETQSSETASATETSERRVT